MKHIRMIAAGAIAIGLAAGATAQSGDTISNSAAVYATFQSDVTDIKNKPLSSAGDIDDALNNLGGQNSDQLTKGWIAYSALVASQDPEYRAAVRDIESFYGRETLMTGLKNDARYARTLGGGNNAVSSALTASEADSMRLNSAAAYVKEQAYSLQGKGWAKAKIGNSGAKATRLNTQQLAGRAAKGTLVAALGASDADSLLLGAGRLGAPSLWETMTGAASVVRVPAIVRTGFTTNKKRVKGGKEPIADQIATLAAYRVIGSTGTSAGQLNSAMSERETSGCMKMAQLNLQQCVAAAHQQYEVPFCIGEHALADVGSCIGNVYQ